MKFTVFASIALVMTLAGCGGRFETSFDAPIQTDVSRDWTLEDVVVVVPDTLTVTESNRFAPRADIVWHGDPDGDRREQVAAVLEAGIRQGSEALQGTQPVVISATLERFHAVTPRAVSAAPAAVHDITFTAQVLDSTTGNPLTQPQRISAALEANVGSAAVVAAAEGQTQKVRIQAHLARVTAAWLGQGADVRRKFTSLGR